MSDFPTALAGALADRYTLQREVGRGGMATVYLAEDLKHHRPVAIKVLHPDLARSLGAERFLREIGIAARLAHPHILPLLDSGEAGGQLYYVTPHVPDGSLRQRLDQGGRMPVAEALRVLREVGGALDYAHRQGFVHRDVKPENVLFADGHALLADFGIARACDAAVAGDAVTEVGLVLGTPEYMSPEQAAGEQALSAASDAYSLACVAYELLTGEPPLRGAGARATMAKQVIETPQPLRVLRPEVPLAVERALARGLAKQPADRYSSVAEFIVALEARDPGDPGLEATRTIAVLPLVNASPEPDTEYLSDGITDELIDALAKVEGLRVASRTSVFALKGKPADVRAIGAQLGADWVLDGTVRRAGQRLRVTAQLASTRDGRLLWSQRYDRTLDDMFALQEEIAHTIVETLRTTQFADLAEPVAPRRATSVVAHGLYLKGRYAWNKRSQEGINEAIGYFERAIAEDPDFARAYAGLADSYALSLDYRSVPVAEGFARADEYARKALALDERVAEAHASLAWKLFVYDWDWPAAEREFLRAIELDPHYATARQWHSFWLAAMGRHDEALPEVLRAQELDPVSVSIRRSVGWANYYAKRFEAARHHLVRAIAMNPTSDETFRVLGLTLVHLRQFDEAERMMREALLLSDGSAYNSAMLAYMLAMAGRGDEALPLRAGLLERARTAYVSPIAFATIDLGLGQWDSAIDWMEKGHAERRGWLAYVKVNPICDPVREHPRFKALVARMKL